MNAKTWIHGLSSTFIGGAASCVTVMAVAPETFNLGDLKRLGTVALILGIVNACFYLQKSPLPDDQAK